MQCSLHGVSYDFFRNASIVAISDVRNDSGNVGQTLISHCNSLRTE